MYNLMLQDILVAKIDTENGEIIVLAPELMPLDLPSKEAVTLQDRLFNISSFQDWCATRVLMMGQKHAKLICNALAISQENSSQNKAKIALAYHCSNLMDAYWVKEEESPLQYKDVSLFQNTSRNVLTPVSLKGKLGSVFTKKLKNWTDIGADGTLAKSWVRGKDNEYYLYKKSDNMDGEVLASNVLSMLGMSYVSYEQVLDTEDAKFYTRCKCFTNEDVSFIPYHTYALKYKENAIKNIRNQFPQEYANLTVLTYLIGNEDLHDKNWGLLRDNHTGAFIGLAPYFDLDGCFLSYTSSKNLSFLPECHFILEDGTITTALSDNFDYDMDYEVDGPTIEEAALKYCPYCTIDFDNILFNSIPEKYQNEFKRRVECLRERVMEHKAHMQNRTPIEIDDYER